VNAADKDDSERLEKEELRHRLYEIGETAALAEKAIAGVIDEAGIDAETSHLYGLQTIILELIRKRLFNIAGGETCAKAKVLSG
jgi:hypothetical protein